MWDWCDELKLNASSCAFVKRDIRSLPLTDAEVEADFFLDPKYSTKRKERWVGSVIQREGGAMLALEEVPLPPPTVNGLANLLAHAMLRPWFGDRQRPRVIHLRDRPQWQELLPHLRQLGIEVVLGQDLPWFDESAIEWIQHENEQPPSTDKIEAVLRKPFPHRKRSWFTDAMALMQWSDALSKGAYPSRKTPLPLYEPTTTVSIHLAADGLEPILTCTDIAKAKKLRPRLEAMAAAGESIKLNVTDWSCVVLALCGAKDDNQWGHKRLLRLATRIANQLAEALGIDPPSFSVK